MCKLVAEVVMGNCSRAEVEERAPRGRGRCEVLREGAAKAERKERGSDGKRKVDDREGAFQ